MALEETVELVVEENTRLERLIRLLNVVKKPADILDDLWNAIRQTVPEKVGPIIGAFLIGSVSFLVNLLEGYNARKDFLEAYNNEEIGQRKTRLLTSFLSFFIAGAGLGLSTTMLTGGFGELGLIAEIGAMALLPFVIPTLLFGIYSLSLWKDSYVLHRAKEIEAEAKSSYEDYIKQPGFNPEQAEQLFNDYSDKYNARREAEREVALKTVEVAGSALVCLGVLLSTAAIIGASAASMGALPLALLIAGAVMGLASKAYEYLDKEKKFEYSDRLRSFFRELFNLPKDEPAIKHAHQPTLSHNAGLDQFYRQGAKGAAEMTREPSAELGANRSPLISKSLFVAEKQDLVDAVTPKVSPNPAVNPSLTR